MGLSAILYKTHYFGEYIGSPPTFNAPKGSGRNYLNNLQDVFGKVEGSRVPELIKKVKELFGNPTIAGDSKRLSELGEEVDKAYEMAVNLQFINPDFSPTKKARVSIMGRNPYGLTLEKYEPRVDSTLRAIISHHTPPTARKR